MSNWKKQKCSVPRKSTAGIWGMFAFMFVLGLEKYQGSMPSFSSDPLLCVKKKGRYTMQEVKKIAQMTKS